MGTEELLEKGLLLVTKVRRNMLLTLKGKLNLLWARQHRGGQRHFDEEAVTSHTPATATP